VQPYVQRPARSLVSSTTVAWNVIASVEFGWYLHQVLKNCPERTLLLAREDPCPRPNGIWSHGFNTRFLNKKQLILPRITRCPSGGPRESAHLREELGTTPLPGNGHPRAHPNLIPNAFGWALGSHPSPSQTPADSIQSPSKTRLDGQSAGHDEMRILLYVAQTRRYVLLPSKNWRYGACPKN